LATAGTWVALAALVVGLVAGIGWWRRASAPLVLLWQREHDLGGWSGALCALSFSPNGQLLALAGETGGIQLWRARDGSLVRSWTGEPVCERGTAFSADGTLLHTAVRHGNYSNTEHATAIQTWRVPDGALVQTSHSPRASTIADLFLNRRSDGRSTEHPAISPDGRLEAVGGSGLGVRRLGDRHAAAHWSFGRIRIPGNPNGCPMGKFPSTFPVAVLNLSFSPDSRFLVVTDTKRRVTLFRVQVGRKPP